MAERKDLLSLSPKERSNLSKKIENPDTKSEPNMLQVPLVRVKKVPKMIRPVIACNECGERTEGAEPSELKHAIIVGCWRCGFPPECLSIHDSWE